MDVHGPADSELPPLTGNGKSSVSIGKSAFDALSQTVSVPGYSILAELGRGGMGVVFKAAQERPYRLVALKVVSPEARSDSALKRFEYESQILGRLRHPSIAQVYSAGTYRGHDGREHPFFAMELVEGRWDPLESTCRHASLSIL